MLLKTSYFASLKRSFCGLQDFSLFMSTAFSKTCIWLKVFFYLLHYLHGHFACQYKRGNHSHVTSGWYFTPSCLSLVCSAAFLSISLPSLSGSVFLMHLALTFSSRCHIIIITNKMPPLCWNHAKTWSSHVKQFAASLMNWLGFTFLLHLTQLLDAFSLLPFFLTVQPL